MAPRATPEQSCAVAKGTSDAGGQHSTLAAAASAKALKRQTSAAANTTSAKKAKSTENKPAAKKKTPIKAPEIKKNKSAAKKKTPSKASKRKKKAAAPKKKKKKKEVISAMTSNIMPSTSRDRAALAQFVDKASYMFVGNASRLCFAKWIEEGAASKLGDEIKALHSPLFAAVLKEWKVRGVYLGV